MWLDVGWMFVDVGAVFHVVVMEEGGRCGVLVVEVVPGKEIVKY